jgi:hypothetical protein
MRKYDIFIPEEMEVCVQIKQIFSLLDIIYDRMC